ncbi:class I SAM-dependent methyltransferase [Thiobacillus thioparus]|uniref:class I SAM-dependent methyltransferase n=1 Tax=Thiobacillus thioparus TaxID=931 RepID=UPI00146167EF|nr:methyltransferase domain-containing protein [Thiobacillus thioparus]
MSKYKPSLLIKREWAMDLLELKAIYKSGVNIIDYLVCRGVGRTDAIAISYDLQAGTYTALADENSTYIDEYTSEIAETLNTLGAGTESIMEAGVGEATTLANVRRQLRFEPDSFGFDISLSRALFGQKYFNRKGRGSSSLFVGDMFSIPLADDSVDIVYTSHSIEPNGGREEDALSELYRVARKYLILYEPSYEMATNEGRQRMDHLGYVRGLPQVADKLGMNVSDYRLTKVCSNSLNPTAMLLIEKNKRASGNRNVEYRCPNNGERLQLSHGCYWSESSLRIYPVVLGIPLLTPQHGIIATHYAEFI